jgi:hypothetical protein
VPESQGTESCSSGQARLIYQWSQPN